MYETGVHSPDSFYLRILEQYIPSLTTDTDEDAWIKMKRVLQLVSNPERRANLHLRYIRERPKVWMPCCNSRAQCFRCKTTTYHEGQTCGERGASLDNSILHCPQCNIQLVKGDGCDSIVCVCGQSLQWTSLLKQTNDARSFAEQFPDDTAEVYARVVCTSNDVTTARAWGAQHGREARNGLLEWWKQRHGWCATQATILPVKLLSGEVEGPMLQDAVQMWRRLHAEELEMRQRERKAALESFVSTYFPKVEDLASPLSKGLLQRLSREERSAVVNSLTLPDQGGEASKSWKTAEQVLSLFGHLPVRLKEVPLAEESECMSLLFEADGTTTTAYSRPSLLQDLQRQFTVGTPVLCKWSQGFNYHDGIITAVRGEGYYDVRYSDGDKDYNVSRVRLKRRPGITLLLAPANIAMSKEQKTNFFTLCKCLMRLNDEGSNVDDEVVVRLSRQYLCRYEGNMDLAAEAARIVWTRLQFLCPKTMRREDSLAWTQNNGKDFFGSLTWREVVEASTFLARINCEY